MRIVYSLLSFLIILSFFTSDLDAKKRGSWGGSKKSFKKSSFGTVKKISKSNKYSSSFDKARDKKAKNLRAKKSYLEYKTKQNSNLVSQSGHRNTPETDIESPVYSQKSTQESSDSRRYRENKVSPPLNSSYIIIGFIAISGSIIFILGRRKSKNPVQELPLDVRIGGIVDLETISNRFITNRDNFQMIEPKQLKGYITAIGKIKLDDDLNIYNIYVSENIDDKEHIFTLKIELLNGVISVVKLFTNYEIIYPSTVAEWEKWLDGDEENYPNIGGLNFLTPSGVEYKRIWESDIEETVRTKFIESISTENTHLDTLNIVSLYGRELEQGEIEYLHVSNIEDAELNNFIKIELGIAIKESELVII